MTETQHSVRLLRHRLKDAGGVPAWRIAGNFGTLELWQVAGQVHLLHGLPADGGVEVYRPLTAASFDDLLEQLPATVEAEGVNGD